MDSRFFMRVFIRMPRMPDNCITKREQMRLLQVTQTAQSLTTEAVSVHYGQQVANPLNRLTYSNSKHKKPDANAWQPGKMERAFHHSAHKIVRRGRQFSQ